MERATIIELARRSAHLTQGELAARAGTTQSAVSMYERRRKVPLLDVAERLVQAAGADLGMVTGVTWDAEMVTRISGFCFPDRLWRVEIPGCFDTVRIAEYGGAELGEWDLRKREDRKGAYAHLLAKGSAQQLMRWVDGALLVDVWDELDLLPRIRAAWAPAVQAATAGQIMDVHVVS